MNTLEEIKKKIAELKSEYSLAYEQYDKEKMYALLPIIKTLKDSELSLEITSCEKCPCFIRLDSHQCICKGDPFDDIMFNYSDIREDGFPDCCRLKEI